MVYFFKFKPYRRILKIPLITSQGLWTARDGIILCLKDEGNNLGFGEIAPLPWFGSETFDQALAFCHSLARQISDEQIFNIPISLPCCQFAFECAREALRVPPCFSHDLEFSGLLPPGEMALFVLPKLLPCGYKVLKWKIGVKEDELRIFEQLLKMLPQDVMLRLDANGGLSYDKASEWLNICEGRDEIEFIEQPLPVSEFDLMLHLSDIYTTKMALDESVANLRQLKWCYQRGWPGVFVIKAAIAGSPKRLRNFLGLHESVDCVFSSAFETAIGRNFALSLASQLSRDVPLRGLWGKRAVGFGVEHYFKDDGFHDEINYVRLWNRC